MRRDIFWLIAGFLFLGVGVYFYLSLNDSNEKSYEEMKNKENEKFLSEHVLTDPSKDNRWLKQKENEYLVLFYTDENISSEEIQKFDYLTQLRLFSSTPEALKIYKVNLSTLTEEEIKQLNTQVETIELRHVKNNQIQQVFYGYTDLRLLPVKEL